MLRGFVGREKGRNVVDSDKADEQWWLEEIWPDAVIDCSRRTRE